MIALVRGQVAIRRADHVVVDANGVGYRLAVSSHTLNQVPAIGKQVTLHAHLVVREDALSLYGFASEAERDLFLLLLGVQGVGPKVALAVLSGGTPRDLIGALAAGDATRFQAVPGIGRRTAERIIVELRDKVLAGADGGEEIQASRIADAEPRALARDGLIGLGYSLEEAHELLELAGDGDQQDSAEELIAAALRVARR